MKRIPFVHYSTHVTRNDSLVLKGRKGAERIIQHDKWFLNRNTPPGDDATWYERKPYGGKREIDPSEIIAIIKNTRTLALNEPLRKESIKPRNL